MINPTKIELGKGMSLFSGPSSQVPDVVGGHLILARQDEFPDPMTAQEQDALG